MTAGQNIPASNFFATLARSRREVAIVLVIVGILFTSLAIFWCIKGWPESIKTELDRSKTAIKEEAEKPDEKEKKDARPDFLPAGVWAGLVGVVCFCGAAWLITQHLDPNRALSIVRTELLAFGGSVGLLTALLGAAFGWSWQESLFQWINESKSSEARWVLYAASVFILGLIIIFASMQLARAEERSNVTLRRMMYGFNSIFIGLLVLIVLIALNIVSFLKLPGTLVTNDSAFVGLSEPSKTFLKSLDKKVTVYLIMPEKYVQKVPVGRMQEASYTQLYSDCRGLLSQCEDYSRNFKAVYLSPGFDAAKISVLLDRLKVADKERDQLGLLIEVEGNEENKSFINSRDLIDEDRNAQQVQFVFQGEHKLINELIYAVDSRKNEVIYVTQDHGELSIEPVTGRRGSMSSAIQYLRDKKIRVAPLVLDEKDPKVPADASLVIIPGPQQTIAEDSPTLKALREYLKPSKSEDRNGKVIAYMPAIRGGNNKVAPTGLEGLMREFGLDISPNSRIVGFPRQLAIPGVGPIPPDSTIVQMLEETDPSLEKIFSQGALLLKNARPITIIPTPPQAKSPFQAKAVMSSQPFNRGSRAGYWQEEDFTTSIEESGQLIRNDQGVRERKHFTQNPMGLAVAVTQSPGESKGRAVSKPKMLIFASDTPIQDRPDFPVISDEFRFLLLSDSLDWLREREANLGIPPKKEAIYRVNKPSSFQSLLLLVATVMIGIGAAGTGVWLTRRK